MKSSISLRFAYLKSWQCFLAQKGMEGAGLFNPLLQRINPDIDATKSPVTAMGVWSLLSNLCQMSSGLLNQNPYRFMEGCLYGLHSMPYLLSGHNYRANPTINPEKIGNIFSHIKSRGYFVSDFSNLHWPENLQSCDENNISYLTPMQCLDIAEGIKALTGKDPTDVSQAQNAIDEAWELFSTANNNETLKQKNYPKNRKDAFLLFCQVHAPYYQKWPLLTAIQSLANPNRNPLGSAQILGCVSEALGVLAGLEVSHAGQQHPLEALNSAVTLALRCLVIAGSVKSVADTISAIQYYQPNFQNSDKKITPCLSPLNKAWSAILGNANPIYAKINLCMDPPTTGVDAVMATLGPEHDVSKFLGFLFYIMDLIIRTNLGKETEETTGFFGQSVKKEGLEQ